MCRPIGMTSWPERGEALCCAAPPAALLGLAGALVLRRRVVTDER